MMKFLVLTLTLVAAAVINAGKINNKGIAVLRTAEIDGKITFTQTEQGVKIEGTIKGLSPGKHGFHIHDKGDLSDGCTSTAGHFNPNKKQHGAPSDEDRHVGDLGNIEANADKVATIDILDKQISLRGANGILGRAVVVHADEDDLGKGGETDSKTTGHAGGRVVCAVIGVA